MSSINCFVIIGFGNKVDYRSGRTLNLDLTYAELIKPVCTELNINCFRASDIIHSGHIELHMFQHILKADIVIADISTLNENVFYELGVRHALKPYTTIIIAEDRLTNFPFDISHLNIHPKYSHLGALIDPHSASVFKKELSDKIKYLLEKKETDSPVYHWMKIIKSDELKNSGIIYTEDELKSIASTILNPETVSNLVKDGNHYLNNKDYLNAISSFRTASKLTPRDAYIIQRLTLAVYKNQAGIPLDNLNEASQILHTLNPDSTTDPETLGLAGAIHKRIFELTQIEHSLDKSISYYEKSFRLNTNYWAGINLAFLYNTKALLRSDSGERQTDWFLANRIRKDVIEICKNLLASNKITSSDDRVWIMLTLAEAYFALGDADSEQRYLDIIRNSASAFALDSYLSQKEKLIALFSNFSTKS